MSTDARTTSPAPRGAQPEPTRAAARPTRRPTIRENVDRELRRGFLALVADLPRRPSEAYDDIARGKQQPLGIAVRRWTEARDHGVALAKVKREMHRAVDRALEELWSELQRTG